MGTPEEKDHPAAPSSSVSGIAGAVVVLATLGGILLWVAMAIAPWRLASGLLDAGHHLERGENALKKTRLKAAQYEVFAGAAAAKRANKGLRSGSPLLDVIQVVPVARSGLGEADHLVAASRYSASAAQGTLKIAKNALRGPIKIIAPVSEGSEEQEIRLDRIEQIAGSVERIRANLEGVQEELAAVDLQALLRRARPSVIDGLEAAREAETVIADAQAGFAILPDVLGADEPRTYLIGMQNPAEQRGTGGALLRFSVFEFDQGRSNISAEEDDPAAGGCPPDDPTCGLSVYDIDRNRRLFDIPLPEDAWYVREVEDAQRFGNSNWSPDWPLSAQLMLEYGEAADEVLKGNQLPEIDGFIALDPVVMEDLIPGTGPFRLDDFGNQITAKKAVHFLLYKAYASYPRHGQRRAALRQVVDEFIEKLLNPAHPTELIGGMSDALASKHMMIWMKDPEEQAFIERMNWDGSIEPAKNGDYHLWVEQNVGGNKFDYYTEHETAMDVELQGSDALVSSKTTIHNGTFFPQPSWAMGDSGRPAPDGTRPVPTHEPMMNLYVPKDAELLGSEVEGTRLDTPEPAIWTNGEPATHEERGKKVWSATLEIPPGEEGSVRFDYLVPGVVQKSNGRFSYSLTLQHQPRVRPESMEISLTLPEGAEAIAAPGWERDGRTLVWSKLLRRDMVLKVSWA
ncbi:MAG: DUF4012 domain-containing protein [Actinomycetota bacterium]|nr:DUF4012 domain-containing protein [Actinomycetota bacterium]